MVIDWLDLGLIGLFLATFLAATVLPFSSEAMLIGVLMAGFDPFSCLITASLGNTFGGMSSYFLGYLGNWEKISQWLKVGPNQVLKWKDLVAQYGAFAALLCWLPLIGDLIAIALGIFRTKPINTFFWMSTGKTIRYAILIYLISGF